MCCKKATTSKIVVDFFTEESRIDSVVIEI